MFKNKKALIIKICLVPCLVILDLITKIFFDGKNFTLIPKVLSVCSHYNDGAAWGILGGKLWLLLVITILFLALIILFDVLFKSNNSLYSVAISFIMAGALGNIIDRIFLGYVRDFIRFDFMNFPIFNLADTCLCIGVALVLIYLIFFYRDPNKKVDEKPKSQDDKKVKDE